MGTETFICVYLLVSASVISGYLAPVFTWLSLLRERERKREKERPSGSSLDSWTWKHICLGCYGLIIHIFDAIIFDPPLSECV